MLNCLTKTFTPVEYGETYIVYVYNNVRKLLKFKIKPTSIVTFR